MSRRNPSVLARAYQAAGDAITRAIQRQAKAAYDRRDAKINARVKAANAAKVARVVAKGNKVTQGRFAKSTIRVAVLGKKRGVGVKRANLGAKFQAGYRSPRQGVGAAMSTNVKRDRPNNSLASASRGGGRGYTKPIGPSLTSHNGGRSDH